MKKFISESWLVLAMGVAFACLLAATQASLLPKIEANQADAENKALYQVIPSEIQEQVPTPPKPEKIGENTVWHFADSEGKTLAWVVKGQGQGFVDKITLVAGFSPDLTTITGIMVTGSTETPGLGDKIKRDKGDWCLQYDEKSTSRPLEVIKQKPQKEYQIEAITGATYSSVYVTDIVNSIMDKILPELRKKDGAAPEAK